MDMFQSLGVTGESLSNVPAVHESVNTTYLSHQLKLKGDRVAGGNKTFSFDHLALQPLSSSEVHFALVNPESKSRDAIHTRQDLELLIFVAARTNYSIGTLRP